jgi:hypothetical protein
MTSFRQIEANRRNAQSSTGPKTETGKQRSRGNAVRHGLTAETVINVLEDPEDYKAFELSVTSDFDAQTAVERELVLRLASLLWRLRRATAIETGLFQIQNERVREVTHSPQSDLQPMEYISNSVVQGKERAPGLQHRDAGNDQHDGHENTVTPNGRLVSRSIAPSDQVVSAIARRFLRLANVDNAALERIGRYEAMLWRQARQILFTLEVLQRKNLAEIGRFKPTGCESPRSRSASWEGDRRDCLARDTDNA